MQASDWIIPLICTVAVSVGIFSILTVPVAYLWVALSVCEKIDEAGGKIYSIFDNTYRQFCMVLSNMKKCLWRSMICIVTASVCLAFYFFKKEAVPLSISVILAAISFFLCLAFNIKHAKNEKLNFLFRCASDLENRGTRIEHEVLDETEKDVIHDEVSAILVNATKMSDSFLHIGLIMMGASAAIAVISICILGCRLL